MSDLNEEDSIEVGDIVMFRRFGNGVAPHMVGQLGLLLGDDEQKRSIHVFDEDEPVTRRCVRVRAENGETVGTRLDQLEIWCNTGTTLVEALIHLRQTEAYEAQARMLAERAGQRARVIQELVEQIQRQSS